MTDKDFYTLLIKTIGHDPTEGQKKFFYAFSKFIFSKKDRCSLILQGYAGTGKTTSVGVVVRQLNSIRWRSVLMAPTGRAAKVLSQLSNKKASTIHKKIYRRTTGKDGNVLFSIQSNLHKNTLFIVDEASMISGPNEGFGSDVFRNSSLLDDLMTYVFSGINCKLMFVGDGAQLPPVGSIESPALDHHYLNDRYNLTIGKVKLKEVVRQSEDSGILFNATALRNEIIKAEAGTYPKLMVEDYPDVEDLRGADVREYIEDAYANYGRDNTIIITRSNKRANYFNAHIRNQILWHDDEICSSDSMMVVRNNYFWLKDMKESQTDFIANGDIIDIVSVRNFEERYDLNFVDATITLRDYPEMPEFEVKLLLDVIYEDGPNLNPQRNKKLYEDVRQDYQELKSIQKIKKAITEDPYYNALQVKYAYALTCHKSQGGQWPVVMIDQGYLTEDMLGEEFLRWLYTAFTRATKHLYLLQFDDNFFVR